MFQGRKIVIATKHQKEKVIAPILEKSIGVSCFIPKDFDTDKLGTFCGEVERKQNPVATARQKCMLAMEQYDCDLALASEGSFGPHPAYYFIPADEEILFFYDKKNEIEIIAKELSTNTNFNGKEIKTENELLDFANLVKFPSHALIIKNSETDFIEHVKGITTLEELVKTFHSFNFKHGKAFVETDMRAMFNPTRMQVIEEATLKLVNKINSICPSCNTPGFGVTDFIKGLPCENCSFPTKSTLSHVYTCQKCSYSKEEKFPHGKHYEEPIYCDLCNP